LPADFVRTRNFSERSNIVSRFDELSTNILTVPPNHLVGPIRRVIPGNLQRELIWNFDLPGGAKPDAPVACVGDEAEKHLAAVCRLQSCNAFERVAWRLALVLVELFGLGHEQLPRCDDRNTEGAGFAAVLTGPLGFSPHLTKIGRSAERGWLRVRCPFCHAA
jgi:hypothetical protein